MIWCLNTVKPCFIELVWEGFARLANRYPPILMLDRRLAPRSRMCESMGGTKGPMTAFFTY